MRAAAVAERLNSLLRLFGGMEDMERAHRSYLTQIHPATINLTRSSFP